jgi:hypothetical protein
MAVRAFTLTQKIQLLCDAKPITLIFFAEVHRVIVDAALDYCDERLDGSVSEDQHHALDVQNGSVEERDSGTCASLVEQQSVDLSRAPALANFKLEREFGIFAGCGVSFCVNVYI